MTNKMHNWRVFAHAVLKGIVCAAIILNAGCGKVFVRTPAEGQMQVSTPFTLEAQKNSNAFCSFREESFQAFLDKGQATEIDISGAFSRPSNSNIWTATNYNLPTGSHELYVEGRFRGSWCWDKFDTGRRQIEVSQAPLPDLTLTTLSTIPNSPSTADPTDTTFEISNLGAAPAGGTVANITLDGTLINTVNVPPINNGDSVTFNQGLSFGGANTYTIAVTVDPNDDIAETTNANNVQSISVTVRDCTGSDPAAALLAARERIARGDASADLDGDCVDEYTRTFDAAGVEIQEAIDTDGDGTPNMIWDKSGATKSYSVDSDQNGILELELLATPDLTDPAIVSYVRTWDQSGDGIPDWRILYTIDPSASTFTVRHESDADQDGNFTFEYESEADTLQEVAADIVTSGPNSCAAHQAAIDTAFDDMWREGSTCLFGMDTRMGMEFLRALGRHTFVIGCNTGLPATTCARAIDAHKMSSIFGPPDAVEIQLNPTVAFGGTCSGGSLKSLLFHEVLHYVQGVHKTGNGVGDPSDRVYACEKTCFGAGDSLSCAACVGQRNGAARCTAYPAVPCPGDTPHVCRTSNTNCPNRNKIFSSAVGCAVDCPSGIACFSATCEEIKGGPCQ